MNRRNSTTTHIVDSSQPLGSMTASNESPPREVRSVKESLLGPKIKIRLGTWNVRTMNETSKAAQVIRETALIWTPPGKRKSGRPKTTWRMTVEAELAMMNLTWGQAQYIAKDRSRWKELTVALCPNWDEED